MFRLFATLKNGSKVSLHLLIFCSFDRFHNDNVDDFVCKHFPLFPQRRQSTVLGSKHTVCDLNVW